MSDAFEAYVVTKAVLRREELLAGAKEAGVVVASIDYLREAYRIKIFAFCVMPDHLHFAICLMPGDSLSQVVGHFSKFTSRRLNRLLGRRGEFWQEGFHDRRCRGSSELADLCEYIEHNPVRAGLVGDDTDWPHSSASESHRGRLDREWWP